MPTDEATSNTHKSKGYSLPPADQRNSQTSLQKSIKDKKAKKQLAHLQVQNSRKHKVFNQQFVQSMGVHGQHDLNQVVGQRKSIEQVLAPSRPRTFGSYKRKNQYGGVYEAGEDQ